MEFSIHLRDPFFSPIFGLQAEDSERSGGSISLKNLKSVYDRSWGDVYVSHWSVFCRLGSGGGVLVGLLLARQAIRGGTERILTKGLVTFVSVVGLVASGLMAAGLVTAVTATLDYYLRPHLSNPWNSFH